MIKEDLVFDAGALEPLIFYADAMESVSFGWNATAIKRK
jgi:hypothetical protein